MSQSPSRPGRRRVAATLVAAASLLGVGVLGSSALFSDTDQINNNTFAVGSIDLTTNPATQAFNATGMAAGDMVYREIAITNGGSLELRYSMVSDAGDALAADFTMDIKVGVTTCSGGGWSADGTSLYSGALGGAAPVNILGDPTTGNQVGDRVLAGAAFENLCVRVGLPAAAGGAVQGANLTVTFTYDSEQTKNN